MIKTFYQISKFLSLVSRIFHAQSVFKNIYFYVRIVWLPISKDYGAKDGLNALVKNGRMYVAPGFVDNRKGKQAVKKKCVLM